jgi:heme/copper-type cytochrome/quinol oxidase subunit 2
MKKQRNKPCSCNSGKKHKRCCGSIEAQKAAYEAWQAQQKRAREARRQRMIEHGRNPSIMSLASLIAATLAMKRP